MEARRTALVTGGSRGIGRAIAVRLAQEGCDVAIVYAGNEQAAQQTAQMVEECGGRSLCLRCDVADPEQSRRAVEQVLESFGGIDVLVNNAGIVRDSLVVSMTEEEFEQVIRTNLNGAFYMTKNTCRQFIRRRSGRIINISSVSGIMGNAGQANYAAAKAGLIGLTKSVAKELAGRNITCNALAPGFIRTDMTEAMPEKILAGVQEQIPCRRMGTPEEIAAAVAFLAGEQAGYITGQVLCVDGGLSM